AAWGVRCAPPTLVPASPPPPPPAATPSGITSSTPPRNPAPSPGRRCALPLSGQPQRVLGNSDENGGGHHAWGRCRDQHRSPGRQGHSHDTSRFPRRLPAKGQHHTPVRLLRGAGRGG